jgi:hypothetical protein
LRIKEQATRLTLLEHDDDDDDDDGDFSFKISFRINLQNYTSSLGDKAAGAAPTHIWRGG